VIDLDRDLLCHNIDELVAAADVEDIETLESLLNDDFHGLDLITDEGSDVMVCWLAHCVGHDFPITLREIYFYLEETELEINTTFYLESLGTNIEMIEGFEVTVELDEDLKDPVLMELLQRHTTSSGWVVQDLSSYRYPFKKPMRGDATVEQWLKERVAPHLKGLRIECNGLLDDTLAVMRGEKDSKVRSPSDPRTPRARG